MQDRSFVVHAQKEERPLGELFSDLGREMGMLVRQEVQLASAELSHKAKHAGRHSALIGAGGAIAYAGLLAVMAAVIIGLAALIPMWLSALLVGLIVVGVGYGLVQTGLNNLKSIDPVPHQTLETLKEDTTWAKHHLVP